jgi:hypothetical protein
MRVLVCRFAPAMRDMLALHNDQSGIAVVAAVVQARIAVQLVDAQSAASRSSVMNWRPLSRGNDAPFYAEESAIVSLERRV